MQSPALTKTTSEEDKEMGANTIGPLRRAQAKGAPVLAREEVHATREARPPPSTRVYEVEHSLT